MGKQEPLDIRRQELKNQKYFMVILAINSVKKWKNIIFVQFTYFHVLRFFFICLYAPSFFFFSIWVFFHEHSRSTGQQGKGEGIYLTPLYHFHPLHRHLDISRAITAGSPLHIAGSRTRTGNLWFPSASR